MVRERGDYHRYAALQRMMNGSLHEGSGRVLPTTADQILGINSEDNFSWGINCASYDVVLLSIALFVEQVLLIMLWAL